MKTKFLLIIMAVSLNTTLFSQSKKETNLIDQYLTIAHQGISGNSLDLIKWHGVDTLKIKIDGELKYMNKKRLWKYLNQLEELTNLNFKETAEIEDAQLVIYFGRIGDYFQKFGLANYGNLTSEMDNWYNRKHNGLGKLIKARFCIDVEKTLSAKRGEWNIKRNLLRCLGLGGNSTDEGSLFYKFNTRYNFHLSRDDKRIINIHYNEKLEGGMTGSESRETLENEIDVGLILKQKF